jgi:hypothetical protein
MRRNVGYGLFVTLVGWPVEQSNSTRTFTTSGEPYCLAGANLIFLISVAASFIFSSRRPLGDSVLNDCTRPLLSNVSIKTTLWVLASRSFAAAASHRFGGGSVLESCCPVWARATAAQVVKSKHHATLFMASTLRLIGAMFHNHVAHVAVDVTRRLHVLTLRPRF